MNARETVLQVDEAERKARVIAACLNWILEGRDGHCSVEQALAALAAREAAYRCQRDDQ